MEGGIGRHFAGIAKATDRLQRVHNAKRRQQANPGMGAQASDTGIAFALRLEPPHGLQQLLIERLHQLQPVFALPVHDRRHLSPGKLQLTVFGKKATAFGQASLQCDSLQAVFTHRADLDQLLPVAQHPQYFATLHCRPMQTGKLIVKHELQNEFGVAPIVLLPPTSPAADLGGMPQPDFATQLFEHSFEPGTVTTCFQADDYLPAKLGVESPHHFFVLVLQFTGDEFASFSFQITDRLLTCMKVNADIYCVHSASFQYPSHNALSLLKAGGAGFITSVPGGVATGYGPNLGRNRAVAPRVCCWREGSRRLALP